MSGDKITDPLVVDVIPQPPKLKRKEPLTIRLILPPKNQQTGGIENAVEGLRQALIASNTQVVDGADSADKTAVHHFHGLWNLTHARLAGVLRKAGRPYVVSPHGMLEPWAFRHRWWKKWPYFHLREKPFLMGAAALFVASPMEREHLQKILDHPRVEILPLGCRDVRSPDEVRARIALGWSPDEAVMVFLSRVDPKKGLHLLVEALALCAPDFSSWRLVIVGDGKPGYLATLHKQAGRLQPSLPKIDWIGSIWNDQRWMYLQAANLFCLPTHSENFGIAVLEALHCGTPVLTTSATPWVEWKGVDGVFIAEPGISSLRATLGEATARLQKGWSEADRKLLSARASDHFAWPKLAPRYVDAYRKCVPANVDLPAF